MSQKDDSEDDIWEYKPLGKKKKKRESSPATASTSQCKKTSKRHNCAPVRSSARDARLTGGSIDKVPYTSVNNPGSINKVPVNNPGSVSTGDVPVMNPGHSVQETAAHPACSPSRDPPGDGAAEGAFCSPSRDPPGDGTAEGGFCPICQMPFSIPAVQSQIGHVTECLDTTRDDILECPDGLECSSTILNHYKRYNHTLLAESRAANDSALFSLSQAGETTGGTGVRSTSILESSQDSAANSSSLLNHRGHLASSPTQLTSSLSNHHASPVVGHLASTQMKNSLLLLRSPRPEDFKKKKGWMTPRVPKTKAAVVKTTLTVSSRPCDANGKPGSQGGEKPPDKPERSPYDDDSISFSPLSELPAELSEEEVEVSGFKKVLFPPSLAEMTQGESEDSLELFSDDEFLNDFLGNLDTDLSKQRAEQASLPVSSTQVELAAPTNQPACTAAVDNTLSSAHREAGGNPAAAAVQSPQSLVLERLRQTITGSNSSHCQSMNNNNNTPTLGSSQTASPTSTKATAPWKPALSQCKAGQVPSLKQTDIGVFFGLKPLKDQQGEPGSRAQEPQATTATATATATAAATYSGGGSQRGSRRGKRERGERGARHSAAGTSSTDGGGPSGGLAGTQGEGSRGGRGTGRARWNRGGDGTRRCPFYKKIPGTRFAIDAFSYGEIEGISTYFLTHFHSDHYGGLTKQSTLPIYCNKITGNLVRTKLKVEERYLHILPMNTKVTVDSAEVILMEANHCPGAAMLLFFLPDGQIVLHTGDFRADPKMESYPELLNCRVQTLYLDTTYCSPEYTFPSQQEAISFAANTAFELVALHPRTLVVCGSYSVGKEKVFLALAEVLGSNVCLSRDKYNTMCCLESEPIRKLLTTDWKAAQVHVLPMMQLNIKKLQDHLSRFSAQYDRLVAFKPTGWTFSQQMDSLDDIRPQISGNITVYGVPYSEHSGFLEMKRFVQWLRPMKIIPTVNTGNWDTRKAMERCFREWLAEAKANR